MLKKTLINNAIVLLAYGLSTVVAWVGLYAFDRIVKSFIVTFIGIGCIAAFLYVLCGFFLLPVEKRSFLSVVSVIIAIIIAVIIFALFGDDGFIYYVLNPIATPLLAFDLPEILNIFVFFSSPLYPPLLFYLGMLLRRLIVKR